MESPTKILLIGAAAAGLIALAGYGYEYHLASTLSNLEAKCVEEGKKESLAASFGGVMLCDRETLADLPESVGIQAEIVAAHNKVKYSDDWYYVVAIGVLAASAVPYIWYFLLRRIRELRNAIMGQ